MITFVKLIFELIVFQVLINAFKDISFVFLLQIKKASLWIRDSRTSLPRYSPDHTQIIRLNISDLFTNIEAVSNILIPQE